MRLAKGGASARTAVTLAVWAALACASRVGAQVAAASPSRCDSVVQAARVDSVPSALYISVARIDGYALGASRSAGLANQIGSVFEPPSPFPLTVFSGPVLMRALRAFGADTTPNLRAPTVTGIYRFVLLRSGRVGETTTVRESLMPGFDSAAQLAIRDASTLPGGLPILANEDSEVVDLRISSDSSPGALRLIRAYFPRMPVVDVVPRRDNPAAPFPANERRDSVATGEVLLRFVVDRSGIPVLGTLEVVRATSMNFVRAALSAMPTQAFDPATIRGCPVAQVVDYPFTFVLPDSSQASMRH